MSYVVDYLYTVGYLVTAFLTGLALGGLGMRYWCNSAPPGRALDDIPGITPDDRKAKDRPAQ